MWSSFFMSVLFIERKLLSFVAAVAPFVATSVVISKVSVVPFVSIVSLVSVSRSIIVSGKIVSGIFPEDDPVSQVFAFSLPSWIISLSITYIPFSLSVEFHLEKTSSGYNIRETIILLRAATNWLSTGYIVFSASISSSSGPLFAGTDIFPDCCSMILNNNRRTPAV